MDQVSDYNLITDLETNLFCVDSLVSNYVKNFLACRVAQNMIIIFFCCFCLSFVKQRLSLGQVNL